jgi:small subunit ribosomal protein S3
VGQKVHPKGFRLGVYLGWDSRWFARDSYGKELLEDLAIRRYLNAALGEAEVSKIEIEKAGESVRIVIHSARPGMVIGKKGQEIEVLRNQLTTHLKKKNVDISVQEVKNPELDSTIVAKAIADQLVKRVSFKKAMKRAAISAMKSGAKGVRVSCSGRLGGAEIAREEQTFIGSVPLHTLRADVDYGTAEAKTTFGIIGIKVWIYKGEFQHT